MVNIFRKWAKQLTCDHEFEFDRNFYGDQINYFNARSLWKCKKCGKLDYRDQLHQEENINCQTWR